MKKHITDTAGAKALWLPALAAAAVFTVFAAAPASPVKAAEYLVETTLIDQALDIVERKFETSLQQQGEIDRLANQGNTLEGEFRQENDTLEALLVFNAELRASIVRQEAQIIQLDESIEAVEHITRSVPQLTLKMLSSIEAFIERDFPFRIGERRERVAFARDALTNPDVSIAERFRQVMVLYQSEMAAGRTNETYPATITFEGDEIDVKIVRIGRVAMLFQTNDRRITGAWDNDPEVRDWVELSAGRYRTPVQRAIRIAEQLDAPDILELPVKAPEPLQGSQQ